MHKKHSWHIGMEIGIWTTVALATGLVCEKVMLKFNLYDGVRHLHWNCSRCCDIDVDRASVEGTKPPLPSRGNSRGGSDAGNPATGQLASVLERAEPYVPPRIEELMRRVSIALEPSTEGRKIPP